MKCRDLHWAMMAHRDQRDVSLSSLRMLIVTDGANPCECPQPACHPCSRISSLGALLWGTALPPAAWAQHKSVWRFLRCCSLGCERSCKVGKGRVGWRAVFIKSENWSGCKRPLRPLNPALHLAPCSALNPVPKCHVHTSFKSLQGFLGRNHCLNVQSGLVPMPDHPWSKEIFLPVQPKPPQQNLRLLPPAVSQILLLTLPVDGHEINICEVLAASFLSS